MKVYDQNWPTEAEWKELIRLSQPFVVRKSDKPLVEISVDQLLEQLSHFPDNIDISCDDSGNGQYPGNPSERESIKLPMSSFIEGFKAISTGMHHWLLDSGLDLYLSQCCVYASDQTAIQIPLPLASETQPEVLNNLSLDVINLWMNLQRSQSTLHYDENHNLLLVLKGCKTVYVIAPSHTQSLRPKSIYSESPNHSLLSFSEVQEFVSCHPDITEEIAVTSLREGDCMFIPEGWWHQVESNNCTVALNFWFNTKHNHSNNSILPFILRKTANKLIMNYCKEIYQKELKGFANLSFYANLSFDSFCNLILTIVASLTSSQSLTSEEEMKLLTFLNCPFHLMELYWIPFSQSYPKEWTILFLHLPPKYSFLLLESWDEMEQEAARANGM